MQKRFSAVRVREHDDGGTVTMTSSVEQCTLDQLPAGEVVVRVMYSSINYKDALSLAGNRGVTRSYPHTPGIDAAGVVEESSDPAVPTGSAVVVHGYDLGMNTWGGFSAYIRVPSGWVVPLPTGMDPRTAMTYGTAGFTAALSVERIDAILRGAEGGVPSGDVVVSGAGGGVGSIAVAMLSSAGYTVTASTGKAGDDQARRRLEQLGATNVVSREEVEGKPAKPLGKTRWIAGVDTTGGQILAGMVKSAAYCAPVTTCGLTQSAELPLTVYPFILRAVQLIGIDSVHTPIDERRRVWTRIAGDLRCPAVESSAQEVSLEDVPAVAASLLDGSHRGRTVVRVDAD